MKMLTKWAALALASASLSAVMALPASASPVKNCNNPSSNKTVTSKCVTDTNDLGNHKISKESWADQQNWTAQHGGDHSAPPHEMKTIAVGQDHGPSTGTVTILTDPNNSPGSEGPHSNYKDILSGKAARGGTAAGNGGSGGGRGGTSTR